MRRLDQRALDHRWRAILVQRRNERLADLQLGDRLLDIKLGIDTERLCRRLDRPLVARSESAQCMLDAITQLPGDLLGDIDRVLRDEIDAHALGADQANDLLHLILQRFGRVVEQQVRLVEEEHQLRLFRIAHLGQRLEQFGEQPEQEGRIELRAAHQPVGGEDVDHPAPLLVDGKKVVDLQRRLAEEHVRALALEAQQLPLDRADAGLGHIAVGARQVLRILVSEAQHGLQVAEVEQQEVVLVRIAEHDVEHAFLGIVEIEQAREQQRAHLRDRRPDREALLAVQVPEHRRIVGVGIVRHAQFLGATL